MRKSRCSRLTPRRTAKAWKLTKDIAVLDEDTAIWNDDTRATTTAESQHTKAGATSNLDHSGAISLKEYRQHTPLRNPGGDAKPIWYYGVYLVGQSSLIYDLTPFRWSTVAMVTSEPPLPDT